MKMLHAGLTTEYWFKLSLLEQLANIGMDIERAIKWKHCNSSTDSTAALYRALELLDLTICDPKNKGPRRKELARAKEAIVDHFVYNNSYGSTEKLWQEYFFDFNYALAIQKGK